MSRKLSCDPGRAISVRVEVVDRADVVKTTTSYIVSGWRICAGHNPGRAKRDGMNLISGICVPDNELSVLRSRD